VTFLEVGGAESGAASAQLGEIPPDLQAIIDAWPGLVEETRREVLAVIQGRSNASRLIGPKTV